MSREIKFRAWDDLNNCWIHDFRIHPQGMVMPATAILDDGSEHFWLYERGQGGPLPVTLQQFTGLKDRNGKEIYEGDIVATHIVDGFEPYMRTVVWDEREPRLRFEPSTGRILCDSAQDDIEVVGNVFAVAQTKETER